MKSKKYLGLSLLAVLLTIFVACEETAEIGIGFLPGDGEVRFVDTLKLATEVVLLDSIPTSNPNWMLVGSSENLTTGRLVAEAYATPTIAFDTLDFFDPIEGNAYIDAQIVLPFSFVYGDSSAQMIFEIYETQDSIRNDSTYYSFQSIPEERFLGQDTASFSDISDDNGFFTIKLDNEWGRSIFNASGEPELYTQIDFQENFLKSLLIRSRPLESDKESIIGMETNAMTIGIRYFREVTGVEEPDSTYAIFPLNNPFNRIETQFKSTLTELTDENRIPTDAINHTGIVHPITGITTLIKFPQLSSRLNSLGGNVVINNAELLINLVNSEFNEEQPAPSFVYFVQANDAGKLHLNEEEDFISYLTIEPSSNPFLPVFNEEVPFSIDDPNFLNSTRTFFANSSQLNQSGGNYTPFNMTRYIQEVLQDTTAENTVYDNGLLFWASYHKSTPYSFSFHDGNSEISPLKLEVTYTCIGCETSTEN